MSARQRAARTVADIERSRAAESASRGAWIMELGVQVKGNEVWTMGVWRRRYLGPLKGACAGVMDLRTPDGWSFVGSVITGANPRVGTIFVAFADGTRHEQPLYQGSARKMQEVDAAIRRFNIMADLADTSAKPSARTPPHP
jgi:hypothetical protein